ncbi:MAG: hypothetical protein ACYSP9_00040 [Planctomycetota bacterium]
MSNRGQNSALFLCYIMAVLILAGCAEQLRPPTRICAGRQSLAQSLDSLRAGSANIVPLKATGRCNARFYIEDKKRKESFAFRLWLNPPAEVSLHGDFLFNARGIMLGSDTEEFWLAIKPKDISTYYWGLWSEQESSCSLLIDPKIIIEALGIVMVGSDDHWSLHNEGPFDVLTQRDNQGGTVKKVYIFSCDYRVFKIEYFSEDGQLVADTELYKYKEVSEGCLVPRVIKIRTYDQEGRNDSIRLNLKSAKPHKFDDKKRQVIFTPPKREGYKHVYRIIDCRIIEESN